MEPTTSSNEPRPSAGLTYAKLRAIADEVLRTTPPTFGLPKPDTYMGLKFFESPLVPDGMVYEFRDLGAVAVPPRFKEQLEEEIRWRAYKARVIREVRELFDNLRLELGMPAPVRYRSIEDFHPAFGGSVVRPWSTT